MSAPRAPLAERAVGLLAGAMSRLAAVALLAMTGLLAFSSIRRYLADAPLAITDEAVGFLLVSVAFLSVAEGFLRGRQVRLLFLWRVLPERAQGWAMVAGHLLALVVLALVVRETLAFAAFSLEIGARSPVAGIPEGPWMMVIPVSVAVLWLAILVRFAGDLASLLRGGRVAPPDRGIEP